MLFDLTLWSRTAHKGSSLASKDCLQRNWQVAMNEFRTLQLAFACPKNEDAILVMENRCTAPFQPRPSSRSHQQAGISQP
jgi:hypothetical protein